MSSLPALLLLALTIPGRPYARVPLEQVATSRRTHIETCGPVAYVRQQQDGDWHITLDNGRAKVVVEIIPAIPLTPPRKRQIVVVRGIRRVDEWHHWTEIHPAEAIAPVTSCASQGGR